MNGKVSFFSSSDKDAQSAILDLQTYKIQANGAVKDPFPSFSILHLFKQMKNGEGCECN